MNLTSRISYLFSSALNYFRPAVCPYCGNKSLKVIDKKYFVTKLVECNNCKLRFRLPADRDTNRDKFYNLIYKQKGITTDLPSPEELKHLLATNFKDTIRNVDRIKDILIALTGPLAGKSILDFGCSWGYMSWQFQQLGMNVQGFEIGKNRAEFGRKNLAVDIVGDKTQLKQNFDFVFSSHVIEHLNDINAYITLSLEKLNEGGFMVIVCPNGSDDLMQGTFPIFHKFWGQVHPNMLSSTFCTAVFKDHPFYISSSPYRLDGISNWDQKSQLTEMHGGDELLCIVKKAAI